MRHPWLLWNSTSTGRRGGVPLLGSGIAEQRTKPFLFKMPIIGEDFTQSFLAHRLHRNAINQAVSFVGPRSVKSHAGKKRIPALRNNANTRILKNTPCVSKGLAAHLLVGCSKES